MRISRVKPQTDYIRMEGGLDQTSPALSFPPGALIAASNYMAGVNGGYTRIDGYERYSGQSSPSDATYTTLTASGTVTVGQTVTGGTSGATGVVSRVLTGGFDVTQVSGTLEVESYTVGGVATGAITKVSLQGGLTGEDHAISLNAAADIYRADISAPTGSGVIRGIEILNGTVYCFRDNAGGTAGLIYKATSSGWSAVTLFHEISFDAGTGLVSDGDTVTQLVSGATGLVKRVVKESGAWGTNAAGRLIITNITGTFDATNELQVGAATQCTAASLATQITIAPGGRYETVVSNFYATSGTRRIYGADGANRGFEFDGVTYVPIETNMTTDTPDHVYVFKNQLFFSFNGLNQNSAVGDPYDWTAMSGSLEFGVGDDITGYSQLAGDALGIFSRNSSNQLVGNNVDDFVVAPISDEVGAVAYTVQKIGLTYCLDDRGIIMVFPTERYGNFEQSTVSRSVQTTVDDLRSVAVASTTYKTLNQYRIYGSDGTGLCMTLLNSGRYAFMPFEYPDNVACVKSGEDANGKDVVFFGSDEGMVYQCDKGSSFDGAAIEAYLIFPFNHSRSPMLLKSYLSATIEMSSKLFSSFGFSTSFSYGDPGMDAHRSEDVDVEGGSGFWDVSNWDEFSYDSAFISSPVLQLSGTGNNINFTIYTSSEIDPGHSLDGILIKYIPRRLVQ